jgi:hypothetical protein
MSGKFRTGVIALVFALLLATVVGSGAVSAQGTATTKAPGRWASSVNVQNLTAANNAITIVFYNANGQEAHRLNDTLTPNQGKSYYLPATAGLPDGQYSAMVSSQGALRAVVNSESQSPNTLYSYSGIDGGEVATNLSFPGLYKNYYGFWSEAVLQNTSEADATATLTFVNSSGTTNQGIQATIPARSSRVFALQDLAQLPAGNQNGEYSLRVQSSQPLAGVANTWTAYAFGESTSYNAFRSGATTVYAPSLTNNYYGFVSALSVQNVSSQPASVTITYSNGWSHPAFTLQPGQSQSFFQPNFPNVPSGNVNGVYSARITSNQNVVALVTTEDKNQGLAASYTGIASASPDVFVPVAMQAYFGYFTAITVQNVGNQPTTVTVNFATGDSRQSPQPIPPNGTYNFIQLPNAGDPLPNNTVTSAVVSSNNGQPLVAVVQSNNPARYQQTGGGDFLSAYEATPQ